MEMTETQKGPDDVVQQWKTLPGEQPQVQVTVEKRGWKKWAQGMSQLRSERDQAVQRAKEAETGLAQAKLKGVEVKHDERGVVLTLAGGVLFKFDSAELLPNAKDRLDEVAEVLKQNPQDVTIEGNTDSKGDPEYNQQLSERRAEAVKDYLVQKGAAGEQIAVNGNGEDRPIASNDTPEGRANNRRVELVLPKGSLGIGGGGAAGQECVRPDEAKKDQEARQPSEITPEEEK